MHSLKREIEGECVRWYTLQIRSLSPHILWNPKKKDDKKTLGEGTRLVQLWGRASGNWFLRMVSDIVVQSIIARNNDRDSERFLQRIRQDQADGSAFVSPRVAIDNDQVSFLARQALTAKTQDPEYYGNVTFALSFPSKCLPLPCYGKPSQSPAIGMSPGNPSANTMSAKPIVFELRR